MPFVIFKESILQHNNKQYGPKKLTICETTTKYTTKAKNGCFPYPFHALLMNKGEPWGVISDQTGTAYDVYMMHMEYTKVYGDFTIEAAIMHQNPITKTWQISTPWLKK